MPIHTYTDTHDRHHLVTVSLFLFFIFLSFSVILTLFLSNFAVALLVCELLKPWQLNSFFNCRRGYFSLSWDNCQFLLWGQHLEVSHYCYLLCPVSLYWESPNEGKLLRVKQEVHFRCLFSCQVVTTPSFLCSHVCCCLPVSVMCPSGSLSLFCFWWTGDT